jgi:hypothetical protein
VSLLKNTAEIPTKKKRVNAKRVLIIFCGTIKTNREIESSSTSKFMKPKSHKLI